MWEARMLFLAAESAFVVVAIQGMSRSSRRLHCRRLMWERVIRNGSRWLLVWDLRHSDRAGSLLLLGERNSPSLLGASILETTLPPAARVTAGIVGWSCRRALGMPEDK